MSTVKPQRGHVFLYRLGEDGAIFRAHAKIRDARRPVDLLLKAEHVRRSIELGGVGNTQNCAMALCAKAQAAAFEHPVEGHIDWTYTRAYVVSKRNKNGLPSECYVYEHRDGIARLNDTKGGQQKLLAQLERNGDRYVRLLPITADRRTRGGGTWPKNGGTKRTGEHAARQSGAKLRYATAKRGLTIDQ